MSPLKLRPSDVGRHLEIEGKTKSRPTRGEILSLSSIGSQAVRVELQTSFGVRGFTLTENSVVQLLA